MRNNAQGLPRRREPFLVRFASDAQQPSEGSPGTLITKMDRETSDDQ